MEGSIDNNASGDIKVQGFRELSNLIRKLDKNINKDNVWKSIWKKVGKPAQADAQSAAPRAKRKIPYPPSIKRSLFKKTKVGKYIYPGTLQESIGFFRTKSSKDYNGMYLGPRVKGKFRQEKGGYFGAWVEYGGSVKFFGEHIGKDQPFMALAFKMNKVQMLSNTFKEGEKVVNTYIKRFINKTKKNKKK